MSKSLISVIVPVYNVEKYLSACIDSIINQTHKEMEIILVDDGSTDESNKICQAYAEVDNRITLIRQANGGLSAARNTGLEIASGEYIAFIDSDDMVHHRFFEVLIGMINTYDADIASVEFLSFTDHENPKTRDIDNAETMILPAEEALERILYQDILDNSVWNKLFHRSIFQSIRFPKGKLYEDIAISHKVYDHKLKIAHKRIPLYYYRLRTESITGFFSLRRTDILDITDEIEEYAQNSHLSLLPAAHDRKFAANMNILWLMTRSEIYSSEVEKRCWQNIKTLRKEILLNPKSRLKNRIGALTAYAGLSVLKQIFRLKDHSR